MAQHADAFIVLPGGFGTLEEMLEVVTWQQLGIHKKPIGILNVEGFFNDLLKFFDHLETEVSKVPELGYSSFIHPKREPACANVLIYSIMC